MPTEKNIPSEVCKTPCPIACASQFIGDMWVLLIIRDLLTGPKRFGDLQQSVISYGKNTPINSKTLTDRLKMLEEADFVHRKAFANEKPPRVEYSLTEKGKNLNVIIEKIREFGQKYLLNSAPKE